MGSNSADLDGSQGAWKPWQPESIRTRALSSAPLPDAATAYTTRRILRQGKHMDTRWLFGIPGSRTYISSLH